MIQRIILTAPDYEKIVAKMSFQIIDFFEAGKIDEKNLAAFLVNIAVYVVGMSTEANQQIQIECLVSCIQKGLTTVNAARLAMANSDPLVTTWEVGHA
jgi:hypothetical protein